MGHLTRRIAILGSTGSIGTQALNVVRANPDRFEIVGLAAYRTSRLLLDQVREFHPRFVSTVDPLEGTIDGSSSVSPEEMSAASEVDTVLVAIPGLAALSPTLAAIRAGKRIALASKEVLVVAGGLVMSEAARHGVPLLPVDSEHSALWQCIRGENLSTEVAGLVLTASGGPFRNRTPEDMARVSPEDALAHPTWRMGPKVTIDSATMMNKGFEVIEAHWLFNMPYQRISVVIHPQSIIHSMVEFVDGTVKAQMAVPDMHLPIQYALAYPSRIPAPQSVHPLLFSEIGDLTFSALDEERFPCFALARGAGVAGATYPAVLNAADEVAVRAFLDRRIPFTAIAEMINEALERHHPSADPSLGDLLGADAWARETVEQVLMARQ
ncbi:MAG: 1-deoxy-D-xylulose-5-phosphate reductoisomerase [Chloroflexi bacterium]|nr:1-deoxy-D-xylulose-5-phosphate reductoisomerase [Chloroflexota bacterium]